MKHPTTLQAGRGTILFNRFKTFMSKPYNVILLLMGIVFTISTIAPIVAIIQDTLKIHPGTIDAHLTGKTEGYSFINYIDLFTSRMANAVKCPVARKIPDNMKEKLDEYLNRKRAPGK